MALKRGTDNDVKMAQDLWDQLKAGLFMVEDTIQKIIEIRAWEPLGYGSFFEAWEARCGDIMLARNIAIRVAYQMLAEGVDEYRIMMNVKGVGPETVKNIKREQRHGLSASQARGARPRPTFDKPIHVRPHGREKASPDSTIHVEVGATMMIEYTRIAKRLGRSISDIAKEAIEQRFRELA